jgi:hypothetical protein
MRQVDPTGLNVEQGVGDALTLQRGEGVHVQRADGATQATGSWHGVTQVKYKVFWRQLGPFLKCRKCLFPLVIVLLAPNPLPVLAIAGECLAHNGHVGTVRVGDAPITAWGVGGGKGRGG